MFIIIVIICVIYLEKGWHALECSLVETYLSN